MIVHRIDYLARIRFFKHLFFHDVISLVLLVTNVTLEPKEMHLIAPFIIA